MSEVRAAAETDFGLECLTSWSIPDRANNNQFSC